MWSRFAVAKAVLVEGESVTLCSSSEPKITAALERLRGGDIATGEALDVTDETEVEVFETSEGLPTLFSR